MNFVLAVYAAPYGSQGAATAWNFAQALIGQHHRIEQIFFAELGVLNASPNIQAELDWPIRWQSLAQVKQIPLYVCHAAALRQGLTQLVPCFTWGGLAQFAQAIVTADRYLAFG